MTNSQLPKTRKTIEVVALAMQLTENGTYLLARRGPDESGAGKWEFPGGKIESGETQQQALVREIQEELNLQIQPSELVYLGQNFHAYPSADILIFLWKLQVDKKPQMQLLDHDMTAWLQPAEMQEISLSPGDKPFISLL